MSTKMPSRLATGVHQQNQSTTIGNTLQWSLVSAQRYPTLPNTLRQAATQPQEGHQHACIIHRMHHPTHASSNSNSSIQCHPACTFQHPECRRTFTAHICSHQHQLQHTISPMLLANAPPTNVAWSPTFTQVLHPLRVCTQHHQMHLTASTLWLPIPSGAFLGSRSNIQVQSSPMTGQIHHRATRKALLAQAGDVESNPGPNS